MNDQPLSKEFPLLVQRDDINEHDLAIVDSLLRINDYQSEDLKANGRMMDSRNVFTGVSRIESSNVDDRSNIRRRFSHLRSLIEKINQIQLTKQALIMIIVNILMMGILIVVSQLSKRSSVDIPIDTEGTIFERIYQMMIDSLFVIEIMLVKRGEPHGGPGGEDLYDDAEIATLRFNDTITRVMASQSVDLSGLFVCQKSRYFP